MVIYLIKNNSKDSNASYKVTRVGNSYIIKNQNMSQEFLTARKVKKISQNVTETQTPTTVHTIGLSRSQVGQIDSAFKRIGRVSTKVYQVVSPKKKSDSLRKFKIILGVIEDDRK